jgi:hypothetical protein
VKGKDRERMDSRQVKTGSCGDIGEVTDVRGESDGDTDRDSQMEIERGIQRYRE